MPKILRRVCATAKVPVLAGGLIADKEDVMAALEARNHCHFHHQSGGMEYVTRILRKSNRVFCKGFHQKVQNTLLFVQGQGIIEQTSAVLFQEI